MSAALGSASVRPLPQIPGVLRVEFGYCTATEIAELYRSLAVSCVQRQISRVLLIAGDDDPAGEHALRDAATIMVLAGIPTDFRLALVIALRRALAVYGNTERDLSAVGIRTRVFTTEEEAVLWLDG